MTDMAFHYNWHEGHSKPGLLGFMDWATIVLITPIHATVLESIDLTDVVMRVTINDKEVDAGELMKRLHENYERSVVESARELVNSIGIQGMEDDLAQVRVAVREMLEARMRVMGIELPPSNDNW